MEVKNTAVIFMLLFLVSTNDALRILVSFPLSSKSHSILGHGFVNHLLEAGHEVVHITTYPRDKPTANLTEISVYSIYERSMKENPGLKEQFKLKNVVGKPNFGDSLFFLYFAYDFHKQILEEEGVVKLLSDPSQKFDVVIIEWFFSQFISGIAPLFKCPLIWVASTTPHWQVLQMIDEIPNPAYTVDLFSASSPPLTFAERAYELWILLKKLVIINLLVVPFEKLHYNKVFTEFGTKRGVTIPSYNEAAYNASFLFINSHPSMGVPYRLPTNAAYIGGYHIDRNVKPLPKDLQQLMDNAKYGVIYFSLGSGVRSADMSPEMRDSLMKMFSKLKQTVIWKFEEDFEAVPPNVHLVKWAPQQSIISHPNLKIFITHGGQLSTTESIYYGVPVIGIPVMADQHVNMKTVTDKGFGVMVPLTNDVAKNLLTAIEKLLADPIYKARAKELSKIFHSRLASPGDEIRHWVQHVVDTRGAPHLRSPAIHTPLYQKLFLDIGVVAIVVIIAIFYVTKSLLRLKNSIFPKKIKIS